MKKLFWCSVAVAVAAAGSVYLASRHVESCSLTSVGHAMAALGGEESSSSGTGTDAPQVPEPAPVGVLPAVGSEDATSVATPPASEPVPLAAGPAEGRIIIEEPESFPLPMPSDFATQTASDVQAEPLVMPFCPDDTHVCNPRMPMADEDEGGEEEAEAWEMLRQAARESAEETIKSPEKLPITPQEVEQPGAGEEYQDYHHHHHEMICPYTGRSYDLPKICPPAPEPSEPEKQGNNTKKDNMGDIEEQEPLPHQKLDTMEFRPSDAGFQHFVPGPF